MTRFSTDISIQRDWIARKGNDNNVTINLTSGGSAFNVATYTGALYVFRLGADYNNLENAVISKTQGSGLTNGGAAGTWAAVITAANLSALQPDQYFWKFQVTHPDATVHDWFNGQFTLQNERYVGDVSTTVTGEINVGGTTIDAEISLGTGQWISIGTHSTSLTFDSDKDIYLDATGQTLTYTLAASGHNNGVGIILRLNKPTAVNAFPASFEELAGSDAFDATKMNIYFLVYYSHWNGTANPHVTWIRKIVTAL